MDPTLIILFIVLFLLSAFFSWTEIALMSLPEHKLDAMLKEWRFWSKSLKKIKSNTDRLLITILIWNNLVNTFTAALATSISISIARTWWMWVNEATAIWISTWLVTFLLLVFWEIVPKSFASKNSSKISLFVAPIYNVVITVLFPIIYVMEIIIKIFSRRSKWEIMSYSDIHSFIDLSKESWALDHNDHEKIKGVLELDNITVEEIMTPRVKIEALSIESTVRETLNFYLCHTHSRIPLYKETIDKIDYFITSRDLLLHVKNKDLDKKLSELKLKEVMKIPLNQSISTLLENFQESHKIMAIVIDEYGWVSGLITMEDIIEQVFWEIRDETDIEVEVIKEHWENCLLVESDVLIEDVLYKFGLYLPDIWLDKKEFDWETLSYILTHILERFPETWEIITFDILNDNDKDEKYNLNLKVRDVINHKIWKVEVKKELEWVCNNLSK